MLWVCRRDDSFEHLYQMFKLMAIQLFFFFFFSCKIGYLNLRVSNMDGWISHVLLLFSVWQQMSKASDIWIYEKFIYI